VKARVSYLAGKALRGCGLAKEIRVGFEPTIRVCSPLALPLGHRIQPWALRVALNTAAAIPKRQNRTSSSFTVLAGPLNTAPPPREAAVCRNMPPPQAVDGASSKSARLIGTCFYHARLLCDIKAIFEPLVPRLMN
jgi:hypothetical protein